MTWQGVGCNLQSSFPVQLIIIHKFSAVWLCKSFPIRGIHLDVMHQKMQNLPFFFYLFNLLLVVSSN